MYHAAAVHTIHFLLLISYSFYYPLINTSLIIFKGISTVFFSFYHTFINYLKKIIRELLPFLVYISFKKKHHFCLILSFSLLLLLIFVLFHSVRLFTALHTGCIFISKGFVVTVFTLRRKIPQSKCKSLYYLTTSLAIYLLLICFYNFFIKLFK